MGLLFGGGYESLHLGWENGDEDGEAGFEVAGFEIGQPGRGKGQQILGWLICAILKHVEIRTACDGSEEWHFMYKYGQVDVSADSLL